MIPEESRYANSDSLFWLKKIALVHCVLDAAGSKAEE